MDGLLQNLLIRLFQATLGGKNLITSPQTSVQLSCCVAQLSVLFSTLIAFPPFLNIIYLSFPSIALI